MKFHRWPFPSGKVICFCPGHHQEFSLVSAFPWVLQLVGEETTLRTRLCRSLWPDSHWHWAPQEWLPGPSSLPGSVSSQRAPFSSHYRNQESWGQTSIWRRRNSFGARGGIKAPRWFRISRWKSQCQPSRLGHGISCGRSQTPVWSPFSQAWTPPESRAGWWDWEKHSNFSLFHTPQVGRETRDTLPEN